MLVNDNGMGWKETFRELYKAQAYAKDFVNRGFYVTIFEHNTVPKSYHYAGD
jgi:7-keto-8-aminopelargonate synthetase-like enzyme